MPKLRNFRRIHKEVREEVERVEKLQKDITRQFRLTLLTTIGSAFAFVTAFFWRDAINETIAIIVPPEESLLYKYLAAFLVTALAVVILYAATKVLKKGTEEKKRKRKV